MIRGVLSGKGGVGKTTTTINLGLAMHILGENVVVVDGDIKNSNLGLHLGILKYNTTLQEVIEKKISILNALYIHETGLRFIPAHVSLNFLETDLSNFKNFLKKCPYNLLIDSPPGLNKESLSVLRSCDEILVVLEPYLPDITDCMKTIELAKEMNIKIGGIILNKQRNKNYEFGKEEIEACTNTKVISTIPFDENILRSLKLKNPIVNYRPLSKASINYFKLASELSGKEFKVPKLLGLRRVLQFVNQKPNFFGL